jgi:hypothetical protein
MKDSKASCENGTDQWLYFAFTMAMHRPSGDPVVKKSKKGFAHYLQKFADGTNPSQRVNDNPGCSAGGHGLNLKVPWNGTGKLIVESSL